MRAKLLRKELAILCATACMLSACGNTPLNIIDDKYRTTYEVFVYSFYDSDGDGIGDLQGLIQKLDYINDGDDATDTDLGCNEIWLMPICPSTTYHKYDVTDYKDIDPQYGSMDDFDELVKACHDRKINIIVDTVLNHTSDQHPWFKEAASYIRDNAESIKDAETSEDGNILFSQEDLTNCKYLDYYNFSKEKKEGYEPLKETDIYYEARFWSGMPDLNLDSEDVRAEIQDITGFWTEHGVDGFRLDAVTSYYTGDDESNIEFMTWLNSEIKEQNKDAYIVGEAWTNIATYSKYYASGIDSFFDFDMSGSEGDIAKMARGKYVASKYADSLANTEKIISEINPDAINAPFYTNHDMARSAGYYTGKHSEEGVKLAGALNLLTSGNAFIYYGEELGMVGSGKDENKRAPMQWGSQDAEGMCDGPADMDSFDMKYPSLEEQMKDPKSIYNYYKAAIRLRNTYPVIARGVTEPIEELADKDISCYIKKEKQNGEFETGSLLFLINISDEAREVDLGKNAEAAQYTELAYSLNATEAVSTISGEVVTVPAFGIAVLTKK